MTAQCAEDHLRAAQLSDIGNRRGYAGCYDAR
jgi:hypothetical protein